MTAIQQGPAGIKQKEIQKDYPNEEGLTGGTQKQKGRTTNLIYEKSLVSDKEKVGL